MPASARDGGSTRRATTRRSTSHRSIARWRAALPRRTSCWPSGKANGRARSRRCTATTPTDMKRRFLLASLLVLPTAARAQADEWQTIVAPDLRFRLEMPAPATKSTADEKEKGHASPRIGWESRRGEQIFNFDYVDYDAGWFSSRDSKDMARELGREI